MRSCRKAMDTSACRIPMSLFQELQIKLWGGITFSLAYLALIGISVASSVDSVVSYRMRDFAYAPVVKIEQ